MGRFHRGAGERADLALRLADLLGRRDDVRFAYVHGSFVSGDDFADIDVALELRSPPASPVREELALESSLEAVTGGIPVDVRLLAQAPLSFRYQVIKGGKVLLAPDDEARTDCVEATIRDYLDFAPHRRMYLEEALGLGRQS
jgi:hypothetical protein